jgi:hypothetical protein
VVAGLLLILSGSAHAINSEFPGDEGLIRNISFTEAVSSNDSSSCVIPFTRAGNLMLIKARADTTEGNFILDTGAPHLVLNITYFRDYPTRQISDGETSSVTGTTSTILKTTILEFTFGSLQYFRSEADLIDLGHIENSKGVKILGLVGIDMFKQCEMIIDYENNLIYLHRIGRKEASKYRSEQLKDPSTYTEIAIEIMENRIIAKTELNGKKYKFIIDCAAESNILHSKLPDNVFENVVVTGRIMLTGSGTQSVEALSGNLTNMRIGGQEIGTLPVLITNLENTCFSLHGCIDGVLGFDFLSLHKVGFNFVKRKMYIWK